MFLNALFNLNLNWFSTGEDFIGYFKGIKFCGFRGFRKNREIKSRRKICNKLSSKLNHHETISRIRLFRKIQFFFKQTYTVFIRRYKWCLLFISAFLQPEKTWFVYLDPPSVSSSGVCTFVFLVLESVGTSTALLIRKICEKIWTSPIREIRKIFRNGPSAKLNTRKGFKILRMKWSEKFNPLKVVKGKFWLVS